MSTFWLGFAIGFLFLLVLLVVIALFDDPQQRDAQRVARDVRDAKRQIDSIFADTRNKMEARSQHEAMRVTERYTRSKAKFSKED